MIKEIDLNADVEKERTKTRELVRDTLSIQGKTRRNLYTSVVDELSDRTRSNPSQIGYLDVYETALSVFRTSALKLREEIDELTLEERLAGLVRAIETPETVLGAEASALAGRKSEADNLREEITGVNLFSNRYALYFAGQVGLALLGSEKTESKLRFSFGSELDSSTRRDNLTGKLADMAAVDFYTVIKARKDVGEKPSDDDLKITLENIFTTWINQFNWKSFEDVAKKYGLEETMIKFGSYSVKAGEFKRKYSTVIIDDKFMNVKKEDVIGNKDFVDTIYEGGLRLLGYNNEKKKNPLRPPTVIFTFGQPGGGKTFGSHACIQSIAEEARKRGIPLMARTHSVTDYASHFQNQTANQLNALVDEIRNHPGPVIMYVADADIIFMSRKDPQITQEQKQTSSVYMKMFDGSVIPKNGKFMAIMDANYIDGIDDATKSRVFDVIKELKRFDRPEDFAELARRTLTKGTDGIKTISDADWQNIGKYILSSNLSNREVTHVLGQLYTGFRVEESLLDKPYEEQEQFVIKYLESLDKNFIIGKFDSYIKTRVEIEESSRRDKLRDDLERYRDSLRQKHNGTGKAGG
jgi:hypothetical protein